jgi:uncharacterized protein (TIGR00288 family)
VLCDIVNLRKVSQMVPIFSEVSSTSLFSRIRKILRLIFTQFFVPFVSPVALLIDGDNHSDMSSELLAQVLVEAGKFGGVMIRKVYGNWREPTMDRWKDFCLHYALEPVHFLPITAAGKNAADIALALDALDLYRCHNITHFCLVTSDSDYLPLVQRLRANGCLVVMMGRANTLPAVVKASSVFIALDHLGFNSSKPGKGAAAQPAPTPQEAAPVPSTPPVPSINNSTPVPTIPKTAANNNSTSVPTTPKAAATNNSTSVPTAPKVTATNSSQKPDIPLKTLLLKAYEQAAKGKKDGWVSIQGFHAALVKLDASFKLSDYHYKNFATLFQAHVDLFETRKQSSGHLALRKRG